MDRLDRPVDAATDHILGPRDAEITLVEYGSYACQHCRAANERIAEVRAQFGDRLRYVFRHRPIHTELARPSAELAESAPDEQRFWDAHVALMTRSETLTADDLRAVSDGLGLAEGTPEADAAHARAAARVDRHRQRAGERRVHHADVLHQRREVRRPLGRERVQRRADRIARPPRPLGHRVRSAALEFARWAPSAGVLLLLATLAAIAITNSPQRHAFDGFWHTPAGITLGGGAFSMSMLHWVNDGLLTIFFLVVGLEITREFSVGHLSTRKAAALPIAAAIGDMAVPVLLYMLVVPGGEWAHGWGVPMATDTAFAVALIVMMGVVLAAFIPTRPPPNLHALRAQADAILIAESRRGDVLRGGPSAPAMRAPIGIVGASALAVRLGVAAKPAAYTWRQLAGAGALADIGFTMSLFIAGQAFPDAGDFAAAKIAVFIASVLAAVIGVAMLWNGAGQRPQGS